MSAQWTGELIGKMHNARVTAKQLAAELGKNPKYVSCVLNGHYAPRKAEQEFNAALERLAGRKNRNSIVPKGKSHERDCQTAVPARAQAKEVAKARKKQVTTPPEGFRQTSRGRRQG